MQFFIFSRRKNLYTITFHKKGTRSEIRVIIEAEKHSFIYERVPVYAPTWWAVVNGPLQGAL